MKYNDFNDMLDVSDEIEVTVKDQVFKGILIQARVDPDTIPKEYYVYQLRDWDGGIIDNTPEGVPCACEIKNGNIVVNFMGIFCSKTKLPLEEGESFTYDDGLDIGFI